MNKYNISPKITNQSFLDAPLQTKEVRVSVAMAVWNGEEYINEQIDSILDMMESCDELIISYEECVDRTLDIIKEYEAKDKRVKLVFDRGHSVEENFNNAVANCQGKFIFLADQDDVWIDNKINKMVEIFESNPQIKIVIGDGYVSDSKLRIIGGLFETYHISKNPLRNFVKGTYLGCQMAFSSDIKEKVWPVRTDPPIPHDLWLGVQGSKYGKMKLLFEKLIIHRVHDRNYSNTSKMSLSGVIKNRLLFLLELIKRT